VGREVFPALTQQIPPMDYPFGMQRPCRAFPERAHEERICLTGGACQQLFWVEGEVFRGEQRKLREPRWTEGHEKSPLEGGLNPYLGRHGGDRFSINPSALGAIHLLRRNNEKWALERN
jgi:hypothetical protein